MKSRFFFLAVSILAVFSMLLTACGAEATPTPAAVPATDTPAAAVATNTTGATGAATDTPAAAAATPTLAATAATTGTTATATTAGGGTGEGTPTLPPAADTPTPRPGEVIARYNISSEPDTTDPQKMSFVNEIGWGQLAFEALMELNAKLEPVPAAAQSLDVSPDGLTYTATLRSGLKYSDGTPLTAKNFEYAFQRLFDPTLPGRDYASVAYDIKGSQDLSEFTTLTDTAKLKQLQDALGVHATDDTHISFTLNKPVTYFPYILAIWVGWPSRQDMVQKGGDSWTEPATYIGNGPFVLQQWNHQSNAIWEANPNYRKGKPKIDRLEMRMITDSNISFQAYRQGELDWITVAPEDLKTVQSDATLKAEYTRMPGSCSFYLGFNTKKAPFDNIKVRQAFAKAFDRQDYVDVVLKGAGQPADSFIPPGRPGYNSTIKQYPFDATQAKSDLDAVVKSDFPNGLPPIKLTFANSPRNQQRMEWVQSQMKTNLNVDAQLDPVEPKAYTALTKQDATTPQMFFLGWCQDYPDPQDWLSLVFRSNSTVTHVGWKNAQFDQLTLAADIEKDPAKRTADYNQAQKILSDEAPVVFLYWDVTDWLIQPYVKNAKEALTSQDQTFPGFQQVQSITIQK